MGIIGTAFQILLIIKLTGAAELTWHDVFTPFYIYLIILAGTFAHVFISERVR